VAAPIWTWLRPAYDYRKRVTQGSAGGAWLDVRGQRVAMVDGRSCSIGRDPECDVHLDDPRVSWLHAAIGVRSGRLEVWDEGSRNGTFLDGHPLTAHVGEPLRDGAELRIGGEVLRFHGPAGGEEEARSQLGAIAVSPPEAVEDFDVPSARVRRYALDRVLRIGRARDNDIVLDEPNISREHAMIAPGPPPKLRDLASRNGTRVGSKRVRSATLEIGSEVGIGPFRLRIEEGGITVFDERVGLSLRARDVTKRIGTKTILHPTTLSVVPGEFVALIGQSGSGKSTLLKALAGVTQPTAGEVHIDNDPVVLRQTDIGYVPQSETVHEQLTVAEALGYAAALRLPSDADPAELHTVVDDALAALRLTEHARTRIGALSGGQRKRAATASELLSKPTMLLLDEPTSGLDPGLERLLMELLRELADDGRGVVVVTHATSSLALCDTVAVMGRGGRIRFLGSPNDALAHFGVDTFDDVYRILDAEPEPAAEPAARAPKSRRPARPPGLGGRSFIRHVAVLTARYMRTFGRDRRTAALLLGQAPVLGIVVSILFPAGMLDRPDIDPAKSANFVFMLVTCAIWLGLISSCREIVKERSIVVRELSVGVRLDAYLIAKALVLAVLTAVQSLLLLAVAALIQPLDAPAGVYLQLLGLLVVTAWTAAAMGLTVSTLARNVDQAVSFVPLLLLPQLVFGGSIVTLEQMQGIGRAIANLTFARWAYEGAGSTVDLALRLTEDRRFAPLNPFGAEFFTVQPATVVVILAGFVGAFLIAAGALLSRGVARRE
jgi:ABC transport system ATP-binding/permease protein